MPLGKADGELVALSRGASAQLPCVYSSLCVRNREEHSCLAYVCACVCEWEHACRGQETASQESVFSLHGEIQESNPAVRFVW